MAFVLHTRYIEAIFMTRNPLRLIYFQLSKYILLKQQNIYEVNL